MEIKDTKQSTPETSCDNVQNEHNAPLEQSGATDLACDKHQNITMKDETTVGRSMNMNDETMIGVEEDNSTVNMSIDNSKDDSDFSDYGEGNTRCQMANQAVRAKLLNSVANPANGRDSKLRVSVFDHRIIPKKFILQNKREISSSTSSVMDTDCVNKNLKSQDLNGDKMKENKRKLPNLSYTVLKASKRYNQEKSSSDKSPVSPLESDNDVRTRFDILLRNLIGDVNEMKMESPNVMVSSGYESDYAQNREVDSKSCNNSQKNESSVETLTRVNSGVDVGSINYIPDSSAFTPVNSSLQGSHAFCSLPAFPTQNQDSGNTHLHKSDAGDVALTKLSKLEHDSQGFSYAQRHNYKLTKVTRSMYEIIHDLQNGEKVSADGRKRSKKGRRTSQDQTSGTEANSSARENRMRGRVQSSNSILDNQSDQKLANKQLEKNTSSFSGAVVRCVRRPQCSESSSIQRNLPPAESGNRLVTLSTHNNSNKVQNDLRNLLCGTSDVTSSSVDNNEHQVDFNTSSVANNTQHDFSSTVNGHIDNGFNHTDSSINTEPGVTQGQRRPTLNEQFMNRPKPDDHVYETIPGDEKFYEEWKKMRANTKIPKIRRFTTIPDLPGTFIPKEPPALPERTYLSSNEPQNKDTGNYIFMGDVNSNFPSKPNLNNGRSDSGYASVASDKMLDRVNFQGYIHPLPDDGVLVNTGRHDETSDGYCSIDNLSLLRENITDMSFPEIPSRDWHLPNTNSLPRLPPQRNDYFLSPVLNREEYKKFQTFTERSREMRRQMSRDRKFEADTALFEEQTKPVFQATYV